MTQDGRLPMTLPGCGSRQGAVRVPSPLAGGRGQEDGTPAPLSEREPPSFWRAFWRAFLFIVAVFAGLFALMGLVLGAFVLNVILGAIVMTLVIVSVFAVAYAAVEAGF